MTVERYRLDGVGGWVNNRNSEIAIEMRKGENKSEKRKKIVLVQQQKNQTSASHAVKSSTESKRKPSKFQLKIQIFGLR